MTGITKRQRERLEKVRNNVYIGESIRAALTALDQYEGERREWQRIIAEAQAENQLLGELHTNREFALEQYEATLARIAARGCEAAWSDFLDCLDAEHVPACDRCDPCNARAALTRTNNGQWSCSHCGPHPESSRNWCGAGCGSDYNEMTLLTPTKQDPNG